MSGRPKSIRAVLAEALGLEGTLAGAWRGTRETVGG